MAVRPDVLTTTQFEAELQDRPVLRRAIEAQIYITYLAVIKHPEFPRLLELYKKTGTKTKFENTEYDNIHSKIFRETYATFEIIDFALAYHSRN